MINIRRIFITLIGICAVLSTSAYAETLKSYNVKPETVTVSGISSGGAMAIQAHIAYSGTFKGAAVFAGIPYFCAMDSILVALGPCMNATSASEVPVTALAAQARTWAAQGSIDPLDNLRHSPLYLYSGTKDTTVHQPDMDAVRDFYLQFTRAEFIRYNNETPSGHAWISPLGPNACPVTQSPYVNNCGFDPEEVFLGMFYGTLHPKQTHGLRGHLISVDQSEFLDDHNPGVHSLDTEARMYVPEACERGEPCRLNVVYHGCLQGHATLGDQFITAANMNEWADTNRIIVLYPQAVADSNLAHFNPQGCWDWWGYDSAAYAQKTGTQLLMTKRMVDRITSGSTEKRESEH